MEDYNFDPYEDITNDSVIKNQNIFKSNIDSFEEFPLLPGMKKIHVGRNEGHHKTANHCGYLLRVLSNIGDTEHEDQLTYPIINRTTSVPNAFLKESTSHTISLNQKENQECSNISNEESEVNNWLPDVPIKDYDSSSESDEYFSDINVDTSSESDEYFSDINVDISSDSNQYLSDINVDTNGDSSVDSNVDTSDDTCVDTSVDINIENSVDTSVDTSIDTTNFVSTLDAFKEQILKDTINCSMSDSGYSSDCEDSSRGSSPVPGQSHELKMRFPNGPPGFKKHPNALPLIQSKESTLESNPCQQGITNFWIQYKNNWSQGSSPVLEQYKNLNFSLHSNESLEWTLYFKPCPYGSTNFWTQYNEKNSCEKKGYQKHRENCYWKGFLVHSHKDD